MKMYYSSINGKEFKGWNCQEIKVIPREHGIYEVIFISKLGNLVMKNHVYVI